MAKNEEQEKKKWLDLAAGDEIEYGAWSWVGDNSFSWVYQDFVDKEEEKYKKESKAYNVLDLLGKKVISAGKKFKEWIDLVWEWVKRWLKSSLNVLDKWLQVWLGSVGLWESYEQMKQSAWDWWSKEWELRWELKEDLFKKEKWFWNDFNNAVASIASFIPWLDYAEQVVADNLVEDITKIEKEKRQAKWEPSKVYLTEEVLKQYQDEVEDVKDMVWKDILKESIKEHNKELKIEEKSWKELEQTIFPQIDKMSKEWLINDEDKPRLYTILFNYNKDLNETLYEIENLDGDLIKHYKPRIDRIKKLKNIFFNKLAEKIKKYHWDMEKVSNDDELREVIYELQRDLEWLKVVWQRQSIWTTDDPILKAKRTFQALLGVMSSWMKMNMMNMSDVYNTTIWKLTWTRVESQWWPLKSLDQVWASTAFRIIDSAWNLADSIIPHAVWGWFAILKWWQLVDRITKSGTILNKMLKTAGANEIINASFNNAFEPILSKRTARTDMAIDALSALILSPLLEWIAKWTSIYIDKQALKKYGDEAVELVGKDWTKHRIKISDLATNPEKLQEVVNTVADAKWTLDLVKLNQLFWDTITQLNKLVDKKSSLITAPLVRAYKKKIINWMIKWFEDIWQKNVAEALNKLTYSSEWIDEVFNKLHQAFLDYSSDLQKLIDTSNNTDFLNAVKIKVWETFMKRIWESLLKKGDIDPSMVKAPRIEDLKLEYMANNIRTWPDVFKTLQKAIDIVVDKYKWKKVKASQFINTLINVIDEHFKWPIKYVWWAKALRNIRAWLEKMKDIQGDILLKNIEELWYTTKWTITISSLKDLYKNPVDFYIVLFHELTHLAWWIDLFKKVVWEKRFKQFIDLYKKLKVWVDKLKDYPWIDRQVLNNIERTVLEEPEEFFAYILWEILVKWDSDVWRKMFNLLKNMWLPISYRKFLFWVKKYINTRFWEVKAGIDELRKIKRFWEDIMEWRKAFNTLFGRFLKTWRYEYLYKLLNETDLDKIIRELYATEDARKYIKELWLDEDTVKEIIRYQIMLSTEWKKGFQSWMLWKYIWDLVDNWKSKLENYVVDIFGQDKINKVKRILLWDEKVSWKVSDTLWEITRHMLRTNTIESVNKVNVVSLIFKDAIQWFGLKKSQTDLIWKLINVYKKEFWIINSYKSKYSEFIKAFDLKIKGWVWERDLKDIFENLNHHKLDALLKKWKIKIWKTDFDEILIRYLYNRFNHNIVHTLLKRTLTDKELINLNNKLYTSRQKILEIAKSKNIEPAKKTVWWADNLGAYLIEKQWEKIIMTDISWKGYIYEWWKLVEWRYSHMPKIIEEWFLFDRTVKIKEYIDDIFNEDTKWILTDFTNKLKTCLE